MNPYLIIAFLLAVLGAGAGGFKLGADHELAAQAREDQHVERAVAAATTVSAEAIAKIKVVNTTIQNEVQHEIRTNTVYADCRNSAVGMRLINEAISGAKPLVIASCPQLAPLSDDTFGATASKLVEVAGIYYQCRAAAGVN